MEFAGSRVNIVIFDACRNNPLARSMRSATRGLAPIDAAQGTFVAYSTAPGKVASDGSGKNSPYSAALAKTIVQPGLGIEEVFRDVRAQVMAATDKEQVPWDSSSLTAAFYFKGQAGAQQFTTASQPVAAPAATNPAAETTQRDFATWNKISASKNPADYQAYLSQFPNGTFNVEAHARLTALRGTTATQSSPAPQPSIIQPVPQPVAQPVFQDTATDEAQVETPPAQKSSLPRAFQRIDDTAPDAWKRQRQRGGGSGGKKH
jgi:uncharacterized caspase-like protein